MKPKNNKKQIINKKMKFSKIMEKYPETAEIFMNEGMHCFGCGMANIETIEQGCLAHNLNTDKIVEKLNKKIGKKSK